MVEPTVVERRATQESGVLVSHLPVLMAILSVALATGLIVATYPVFSQTFDEGEHLAAGMEWLDLGTYNYDPLNPPLARVAVALGPYLAGSRSLGNENVWSEGNAILEYRGHYSRTLTLARLGILPFFWLACWLVGRFVARSCGRWHAAVAVFFFALCPPVLANAAVATTDLPFTAMFLCAFVCFWSFLRNPKPLQAVLSGITVGLALLCKLSGLPYLIFPYAGLCIYHVIQKGKLPSWRYFGIAGVALVFTIWAGYRFSVGPILHEGQLRAVEAEQLRRLPAPMTKLFFIRGVPAPQFFKGMAQAYGLSLKQRTGYIFGQTYEGGRWYFFPVAIAVKTPIPLLLLAMVGAARAIMRPRPPVVMAALIAIAGPLGFAMISPVNLGVRHILIIYPFLAMLGAYGLLWLWQAGSSREKIVAYRGVALALLIWSLVTCLRAAPDFIPYFNEAAAPYGSRILVDSDFDWGQDLKRLSAVLQQQRIGFLWIAYEGSADLTPQGIPPSRPLLPNQRPAGWVAISEFCIKTAPQDFGWLEKYQPERVVGKTIRLYHFDSTPSD